MAEKQADKYHRRLKEERRRSHSLAIENKALKAKIKHLRVGVAKRRARAVHWKEKMKAFGARQRAKAKLLFSFRKGSRITAKGRLVCSHAASTNATSWSLRGSGLWAVSKTVSI